MSIPAVQQWDPDRRPHRTFRRGMRGADVVAAQQATNLRLERKGARTRIETDGEWGPKSQLAWSRAATLIGLPHNKPTKGCQRLMRNPALRSPAMLARSRREVKAWRERRAGGPGAKAVRAAGRLVGKQEVSNRAAWLQAMEDQLPHDRLDWMIPGQPYCGFGCIWSWWIGAAVLLPDGTVYTPNICPWNGKTVATPYRSRVSRVRCRRVASSQAKPGALVVMHFGAGGAKHVGLARGPARRGVIPTVEFNTSPGSGGSQANGGGVWKRSRPVGQVLCVLNLDPF